MHGASCIRRLLFEFTHPGGRVVVGSNRRGVYDGEEEGVEEVGTESEARKGLPQRQRHQPLNSTAATCSGSHRARGSVRALRTHSGR